MTATTAMDEIGQRLAAWAAGRFGANAQVMGVKSLGGHSQITVGFELHVPDRETERMVLKVPPPGVTAQNNFDILRQVPVLQALAAQGVPAPQARYWSQDTGAFGGPYLMMSRLAGASPGDVFTDDAGRGIVDRDRQFGAAVRTLVRIHSIGPAHLPGWAVARDVPQEIDHWIKVVRKSSDEAWVAQARHVRELLLAGTPPEVPMGLVHGDYYTNNWVFDGTDLAGVVDWEGASIGPVLIDLGWLCMMYDPPSWGPLRRRRMGWHPAPEDFIAWYREASPLDLSHIDWYRALAAYRLACITAYYYERHRTGKRHNPAWDVSATQPGRRYETIAAMKRIVMFGGGSGSRDITMALCRERYELTRIVPAWDSGGSSKALREALGILAIGDIRQALMTMAHGEERVGSVVRFFNARLSEASSRPDLLAEFDFYASGAHPLLARMDPGIRGAVLNYLRIFQSKIRDDFDFRRGSIGNFVLTGAYFAHGGDINTAIFVFRKLCAIDGNVWPSTTDDAVELHAQLRDGTLVRGQDRVTALSTEQALLGIAHVQLTGIGDFANKGTAPAVNPAVLEAIGAADALLFGPGSFYTSTLAHLSVSGVAQAIAASPRRVPRIFIGNILECPETMGRTLAELVEDFDRAGGPGCLTHVIVNRGWVPFNRVVKGYRYLHEGRTQPSNGRVPQVIADDFEDPWSRGRHDAQKVAATLARILAQASDTGPALSEAARGDVPGEPPR